MFILNRNSHQIQWIRNKHTTFGALNRNQTRKKYPTNKENYYASIVYLYKWNICYTFHVTRRHINTRTHNYEMIYFILMEKLWVLFNRQKNKCLALSDCVCCCTRVCVHCVLYSPCLWQLNDFHFMSTA